MKDFMKYDFNITEIIVACFVSASKEKHRHINRPAHGLALHIGGDKDYIFSDGKTVKVTENSVIYLPRGSTYYVKTTIPGDCYAINFQIADSKTFEPFVQNLKNPSEFSRLFKSAEAAWELKSAGYNMHSKAELYHIICNMQEEFLKSYIPKSKYNIIAPAVEYINKNFTSELLNISKLSEMCEITPEYFRKLFRDFFGDSPISYINKMKIKRATELISSGMYSVSDAAELSGYSDVCHFSREFKKATGVSPSEYLK